jgi:hypothetical protein
MGTTWSAGLWFAGVSGLAVAAAMLLGPTAAGAGETPQVPAERGRLQGRFLAADTGKPVTGARIKVLIQGVPTKGGIAEAVSDADGRYAMDLPLGHGNLWGVYAPAGYYTQDPRTFDTILTTVTEPQAVRDFILQPGAPWQVELHGAPVSADKPPFFSAWPDPERQGFLSGEIINVAGDARGKAVLTIPNTGGRYRFSCGLMTLPSRHEIPPATLDIDKDFDPRQINGSPEPLADRKGIRLRDAAGHRAVVEGVEVLVEAGRAVLRFDAHPIPTASAFVLRGSAVDETGKPVAGAKVTPAFASGGGAAMSQLEARTDAQGKFEMADMRLPRASFSPDSRVSMIVVKPGFHGAQTGELSLLKVEKAGSGDFGAVVLTPGRTLRGKVVDEHAQSVHGAVVMNQTNYFLYSHLQCRTDARGEFIMPDLSYGGQKITAQYGERSSRQEFLFGPHSEQCTLTVRLTPKSGTRTVAAARPPATRSVRPPPGDGAWDLTPPFKEPKYQHEPRYALLVFGPKRETRVWMVLDGTTLYVDRNANGDLTEAGERLLPNNPTDGSNRFGGSGSHTHFDVFEFTVRTGATGTSKLRLQHWIRAEHYTPKTDLEKKWHAARLALRLENSTLWRLEGQGQGQIPVVFLPKPADAQVCALDGLLTFVVKLPEYQVLKRGEAGCDLAFHIVVPGRPYRGAEQQFHNPLATVEVPEGAHLEVEIEYPAKAANAPPLCRKYLLKERC